jgi:hypothetical protein
VTLQKQFEKVNKEKGKSATNAESRGETTDGDDDDTDTALDASPIDERAAAEEWRDVGSATVCLMFICVLFFGAA